MRAKCEPPNAGTFNPSLVGVSARLRACEHVACASPLSSTPASSPAWPWPARRSP
jgi:hypothetical protein